MGQQRAQPAAIVPPWTNITEYTGSVGGPIIKNKTFFFFLWDGMLPAARNNVQATVLTPCARNGVFRYFDGWQNGNALIGDDDGRDANHRDSRYKR